MNSARRAAAPLALLTLLALCPTARAGEEAKETYAQLVLVTKEGQRLEARDGSLSATGLTAHSASGKPISIPLDGIRTLYVADGNQAGIMALCGAGLGLGFGLGVLLQMDSAPPAGPTAMVLGALALGGGLVGGVIGSSMVQWRIQPLVDPGKQYALRLSFSV